MIKVAHKLDYYYFVFGIRPHHFKTFAEAWFGVLDETIEQCPDIGFESYDWPFLNHDTMPTGGFGNLIALPFQKTLRTKGNSVFIDERLVLYPDQWGLLQSIRRMAVDEVLALIDDASLRRRILGVRMPVEEGEGKP